MSHASSLVNPTSTTSKSEASPDAMDPLLSAFLNESGNASNQTSDSRTLSRLVEHQPLTDAMLVPPPEALKPPQLTCSVCCDTSDSPLLQPCKMCSNEYCTDCVRQMFTNAISDKSCMPPRCCVMIQLHIGLPLLAKTEAEQFRLKFEQWLTATPIYCPSPTCSEFISERLLMQPERLPPPKVLDFIRSGLPKVFEKVKSSPNARYFDELTDRTKLDKSTKPIITLADIEARLPTYRSMQQMLNDFDTMYDTFRLVSPNTTLMKTARHQLRATLRKAVDDMPILLEPKYAASQAPITMFPCPTCFIAICADCKKIAHPGKPCDTTDKDYEEAMLVTFHYKRCPKCRTAVKRMFGCSHMACVCGAHWCYHCCRPVTKCDGRCDPGSDDGTDYEDDYGEGEEGEDEPEPLLSPSARPSGARNTAGGGDNAVPSATLTIAGSPATGEMSDTASGNASALHTMDLDAGGARRWAEADEDFGEEPSDDVHDAWSCNHNLKLIRDDGSDVNIKTDTIMECNRCFAKVTPSRNKPVKGKERGTAESRSELKSKGQLEQAAQASKPGHSGNDSSGNKSGERNSILAYYAPITLSARSDRRSEQDRAWGCTLCNILYCGVCKAKLEEWNDRILESER